MCEPHEDLQDSILDRMPLPEGMTMQQLQAAHDEHLRATQMALRICGSLLEKSAGLSDRRFYLGTLFGAGLTALAFTIAFLLLR